MDALKLSAALATYATDIINGKRPDCFQMRDIALLADAVFEQDVSNYGPFGDATTEANDIDAQTQAADAAKYRREDALSFASMVGKQ